MTEFCASSELGYDQASTVLRPGEALLLDERYRLAHLPLVAPGHGDVIANKAGTDYQMGRHARVRSLVLPVDAEVLERSRPWQDLQEELRSQTFAPKIAWDLLPRRRALLHATVCGSLSQDEIERMRTDGLAGIPPFDIELRGLFSGNINIGRLYLPVFPERAGGQNVIHRIQRAFGRPITSMYLVGMHNLVDHLTDAETAALVDLIGRWHGRPLARLTITELWLLGSHDDLVLDASVEARLPLAGSNNSGVNDKNPAPRP